LCGELYPLTHGRRRNSRTSWRGDRWAHRGPALVPARHGGGPEVSAGPGGVDREAPLSRRLLAGRPATRRAGSIPTTRVALGLGTSIIRDHPPTFQGRSTMAPRRGGKAGRGARARGRRPCRPGPAPSGRRRSG
jgi:hypothetical protein